VKVVGDFIYMIV